MKTHHLHAFSFALILLGAPLLRAGIVADQSADLILGRKFGPKNAFGAPSGVAVDPVTHKVFVADEQRHRVLRFSSPASLINGAAAEAVLGQPDFQSFSEGRTFYADALLDRMSAPSRLHCDSAGRLWVCDTDNQRVLRFDNAATIPSGTPATRYLGTGWIDPTATNIAKPAGIVLDKAGNLYVSDSYNHRILRFNNAAALANGAAASAAFGQPSLTAGGPAEDGDGVAQLDTPQGLCVEGDNTAANPIRLYVADSSNHRVLRYDNPQSMPSGASASAQYGQVDFDFSEIRPMDETRIFRPNSVAVDSLGTLFVASWDDERVLRHDQAKEKSGAVSADGVLGRPDFNTVSGYSYDGKNFRPLDLAVDGTARLWVVDYDHKRVLRFDTPAAAANGAAPGGLLGDAGFSSLGNNWFVPEGVAIDHATGKIFVVDTLNHRVLRYAANGTLTAQSVAEAVIGQIDFNSRLNGSGPNKLNFPRAVATDSAGRLWVADSGNNRVLRFESAATLASGASASGVLGQDAFNGSGSNGAPSAQNMHSPLGLATGAGGRLWVSDYQRNRVLRFDNAAAKANGAPANAVLGQPDFTTSVEELDAGSLAGPLGLCQDAAGRLWVCDSRHNRVLGWASDAESGDSASWIVGQSQYFSEKLGALARPSGIAMDASGRLYIANSSRWNVIWFDGAGETPGARPTPNGGLGVWTRIYDITGTSADRFDFPVSLALDKNGSLFVSDQRNTRLMRFLYSMPQATEATVGNGQFKLSISSVPGQNYDIQRSDDLVTWTKETTVTGPAAVESLVFTAALNPNGGQRFFRAVVP